MGWFTKRSKSWEVKNTVLLLGVVGSVSFISFGVLTPIAIAIFGNIVNVNRWFWKSCMIALVYLFFLILALFFLVADVSSTYVLAVNFLSFYIYVVYMSLDLGEYLQRLDLQNYITLEKNKDYNYDAVISQFNQVQEDISPKDRFIAKLTFWRDQISNAKVVENVSELIRLTEIIIAKDESRADLFFVRHGSTIENVLQQYVELDQTYIANASVISTKENLEHVIAQSKVVFENELSNMIETEALQVDGEASVYISVLKGRGIL
ncbi:hypothetical protein [Myroides sp. LoEW2-1]|uniref:hypothetical protein n=1 Tax=Myroides sp. LoEW2-1 TaxID=2683192 RepID=UPI00132A26BE|nr:hypothetical protein [Myroides sp. LoEW2-1]MVX35918.1 hypothetical protein [Myroides sp. LoEW2-1]